MKEREKKSRGIEPFISNVSGMERLAPAAGVYNLFWVYSLVIKKEEKEKKRKKKRKERKKEKKEKKRKKKP